MSFTLYVGDIDSMVSQEKFIKELESNQINYLSYNFHTKDYSSFAFLNFSTNDAKDVAREKIRNMAFGNRYVRVMDSIPEFSKKIKSATNLFVKNFPERWIPSDLHDHFSDYGEILSCKISFNGQKKSNKYGFVMYKENADALEAIKDSEEGKIVFDGVNVIVQPFKSKNERVQRFTNVYFRGFDPSWDKEKLDEYMKKHGTVTSSKIVEKEEGKKFAYVNFKTHEEAVKCVEALHEKEEGGYKLYCRRHLNAKERERENKENYEKKKRENKEKYKRTNLFVRGISKELSNEEFGQLFEKYGKIRSKSEIKFLPNRDEGSACIAFETPQIAEKVIEEMNRATIKGKTIEVIHAVPKEDRPPLMRRNEFYPPYGYYGYPGQYKYPMVPGYPMTYTIPIHYTRPPRPLQPKPNAFISNNNVRRPTQNPTQQNIQTTTQQSTPAPNPPMDKEALGEKIYEILEGIPDYGEEWAPKLTGILINSFELNQLNELANNQAKLIERAGEAFKLMQEQKKE